MFMLLVISVMLFPANLLAGADEMKSNTTESRNTKEA